MSEEGALMKGYKSMKQRDNTPVTKRPNAWLGLLLSALAFLMVQARLPLMNLPLRSFVLPLVVGSALLSLLGLIVILGRLSFLTRQGADGRGKERLLAIVSLVVAIGCFQYIMSILFVTILFTIVPII
jgi:hypothetical protein